MYLMAIAGDGFIKDKTASQKASGFYQSGWADLNRRPPRPKRGALPTALHPDILVD
jgi:hypothetical protein